MQWRGLVLDGAERLADLADLARAAGRGDLRETMPADNHGSGEYERQIVAAGPRRRLRSGARHLAYGNGFSGEQRFVGLQFAGRMQHGIGGHPISFGQHDAVAADDFAPGNTLALPAADDQGARAGQVAQRLEHVFGPLFLHDRDRDGDGDKAQQHQRLADIPEHEIHDARGAQELEHGLAGHLEHDAQDRAAAALRQLVVPVAAQTQRGLMVRQAGGVGRRHLGRHAGLRP